TINLPPLRERKEDIPLLVNYFLKNLRNVYNIEEITIDNHCIKWLQNLSFPGNIRELKNLVERAWLMTGNKELKINDLENALQQSVNKPQSKYLPDAGSMTLGEIEKEMILKAFAKFKGNISKIAHALGISRGTLYRRLEKYKVPFNKED
ncbi:MAG TPA: helix-turn-helix domain-containing protein, partial [Chitinophagaceae bacterium]|nr:helix-turn-helix domain-containing protein [Chitinophagaceae bacterium]